MFILNSVCHCLSLHLLLRWRHFLLYELTLNYNVQCTELCKVGFICLFVYPDLHCFSQSLHENSGILPSISNSAFFQILTKSLLTIIFSCHSTVLTKSPFKIGYKEAKSQCSLSFCFLCVSLFLSFYRLSCIPSIFISSFVHLFLHFFLLSIKSVLSPFVECPNFSVKSHSIGSHDRYWNADMQQQKTQSTHKERVYHFLSLVIDSPIWAPWVVRPSLLFKIDAVI